MQRALIHPQVINVHRSSQLKLWPHFFKNNSTFSYSIESITKKFYKKSEGRKIKKNCKKGNTVRSGEHVKLFERKKLFHGDVLFYY